MENNEMIEVNGTELVPSENAEVNSGNYDLVTGLVIGGAAIAGVFLLKKVVKPVCSYVKMKLEDRKAKKAGSDENGDIVEVQEETAD